MDGVKNTQREGEVPQICRLRSNLDYFRDIFRRFQFDPSPKYQEKALTPPKNSRITFFFELKSTLNHLYLGCEMWQFYQCMNGHGQSDVTG